MFESQPTTTESLSEATIYDILSNRRRRYIAHILKQSGSPVAITELSKQITAWEMGVNVEEVNYDDHHPVYTALKETHLPMLAQHGLVTFDDADNVVTATPALAQLDVYVETIKGNEIPWSLYYVGIAAISVLLFAAVVIDVPGVAALGPVGVNLFTIAAFAFSGSVHYYYSRQSRLGTQEAPPEVRKSK